MRYEQRPFDEKFMLTMQGMENILYFICDHYNINYSTIPKLTVEDHTMYVDCSSWFEFIDHHMTPNIAKLLVHEYPYGIYVVDDPSEGLIRQHKIRWEV